MSILPPIVKATSNYTTPYSDFNKVFKVKLLTRSECGKGNLTEGIRHFSRFLLTSLSFRLPDECRLFLAEIYAIYRTCRLLNERSIFGNIGIFVDSANWSLANRQSRQ